MGRLFFSKTMDRYDIVAACFSPENKFQRCQLVGKKLNYSGISFLTSLSQEKKNRTFKFYTILL